MAETNSINLSLTTLGKCIRAMGGELNPQHQLKFLPYRDSKLTHALKEVFAINVNLSILINITEEPNSCSETLSSLQFSSNCKKITNKIFIQNISTSKQQFNEVLIFFLCFRKYMVSCRWNSLIKIKLLLNYRKK